VAVLEASTRPKIELYGASGISPRGERLRHRREYILDERGKEALNSRVDGIITHGKKDLIKDGELEPYFAKFNSEALLTSLPHGVTEEDARGIFWLSVLTEAATDTYAAEFHRSAIEHGQPWLKRFTTELWTPDEYSHRIPHKEALIHLGVAESEVDIEMKHAQDRAYTHVDGFSPIELTTFGMAQESVTHDWYTAIYNMMKKSNPEAARAFARVGQRENLHKLYYRDMTAAQLEANPGLLPQVVGTLATFVMPAQEIAPKYYAEHDRWVAAIGDNALIVRNVTMYAAEAAGNPKRAGELVIEMADQKGIKLGPIPPQVVHAAFNVLSPVGGFGYGLVGEALLKKIGMEDLYKKRENPSGDKSKDVGYIRGIITSWIADQMPF